MDQELPFEDEIRKLSYPRAPKIITKEIPCPITSPITKKMLDKAIGGEDPDRCESSLVADRLE